MAEATAVKKSAPKVWLNADSILSMLGYGKHDVANLSAIGITFKISLSSIAVRVGGLTFDNVSVTVPLLLALSKGTSFNLPEFMTAKGQLVKAVKAAKKSAMGSELKKITPKPHLLMPKVIGIHPDTNLVFTPDKVTKAILGEFLSHAKDKIAQEKYGKVVQATEPIKVTKKAGALGKLPTIMGLDLAEVEKKAVAVHAAAAGLNPCAWMEFDINQMKYAKRVNLKDANSMYQPVKGTSDDSRYYVIGGNEEFKVAARYSGSKLSIRIEGDNWKKYQKQVVETGFSINSDYASVHLNVGADKKLASKTLGAVILGLGVPFTSPLPEFEKLAKG